jgi:hypothetical protein
MEQKSTDFKIELSIYKKTPTGLREESGFQIKFKILLICTGFSLCSKYQNSGLKTVEKVCDCMD